MVFEMGSNINIIGLLQLISMSLLADVDEIVENTSLLDKSCINTGKYVLNIQVCSSNKTQHQIETTKTFL